MTDESDHVQSDDATPGPVLPEPIAQLGIEAQAEYLRARQRLGLSDEPTAQLGTVGRYRLEQEVGRGGMGVVYRARDPELDRRIAIKLVHTRPFSHYDKLRTRLLREAKVLAKLTHPNVVRIYDFGEHQGEIYLAMEYVEGTTLRRWQRDQAHRPILDAYVRAARGLAAAHERGITHRDFKPDNVLVASDGRVLVGDFGLAGLSVGDELRADGSPADASNSAQGSTTRTGALLGTLTYMAPEQLRGYGADPRSDQFAFCVSLWEALAGKRPFEAEQQDALLEQIERGQVVGAEAIPRRLRARLLRGLSVEPTARFADIEELAEAIRTRPSRAAIIGVMALTLSIGLIIGLLLQRSTPAPMEDPAPTVDTECSPLRSLDEVKETLKNEKIQERFRSLRPAYERIQDSLIEWDQRARALCSPESDDARQRQQALMNWIAYLRDILGAARGQEDSAIIEAIDVLEDAQLSTPPPRALDSAINEQLGVVRSHIAQSDLDGALEAADGAVQEAEDRALELELSYAFRWRGRVLTLLGGQYDDARESYLEAIVHADAAHHDAGRLEFELLVAEISIMRLGNPQQARASLKRAAGMLERLEEPWLSAQRANYHEVLASVLERRGEYGAALGHQRRALLIRYLLLDAREIANGHVNLGNIHDLRAQTEPPNRAMATTLAGLHYEWALFTLELASLQQTPEWFQAAFNLGRWLARPGAETGLDRARELLQQARTSNDLRVYALTELVLLAVSLEGEELAALSLAQELRDSLPSHPPDLAKKLDAWHALALAYAANSQLKSFDEARDEFERISREGRECELSPDLCTPGEQAARLELDAAHFLANDHPARACELAESARTHALRLPEPGEMSTVAEQLILATCTTHP